MSLSYNSHAINSLCYTRLQLCKRAAEHTVGDFVTDNSGSIYLSAQSAREAAVPCWSAPERSGTLLRKQRLSLPQWRPSAKSPSMLTPVHPYMPLQPPDFETTKRMMRRPLSAPSFAGRLGGRDATYQSRVQMLLGPQSPAVPRCGPDDVKQSSRAAASDVFCLRGLADSCRHL